MPSHTYTLKVGGTIRYGVISSAATVALSLRQVWHNRFDYFGLLILATGTPSQVFGFSGNAEEIR